MIKYALVGTPQFAADIGERLLASGDKPAFILTRADKPAGRGQKVVPSPMRSLALRHSVPCIVAEQPGELHPDRICNYDVRLLIVIAFGLFLPVSLLKQVRCVNLHPSLLPRWRGAAPIERAIEAGDAESGITLMRVSNRLDAGPILMQKKCVLEDETETAASLADKLKDMAVTALKEYLAAPDQYKEEPQDDSLASYAAKIEKTETRINWTEAAQTIARRIRAFNPSPGCWTEYHGQRLKIWMATAATDPTNRPEQTTKHPPGTVVKSDRNSLSVAGGDGCLEVTQLQFAGSTKTDVAAATNLPRPGEVLGTTR